MAGFFSLGSGSGRGNKEEDEEREREREVDNNNNNNNNSNNKFLFRNEEIYSRGFEIWPQQQQTFNNSNNYYSFGVAAGPSRRNVNDNDVNDDVSVSFSDTNDSHRFGFTVMRPGGSGGIGGGGGMNCQDCGNQAKKDCPHLRCRTCCKSRGFHCQTHVKSTWVPAAKRRERLQQLTALQQQQQQPPPLPQPQQHLIPSRRHRENQNQASASGTALACAPLPITTTGLELGQFPPELNSPAVFRCVKVSAMDAQDERYAYQTAVNIGGHVFKGILYDQGVDGPYNSSTAAGEGSGGGSGSGGAGSGEHPQNLITAAATTSGGNNPFEYSSLYPAPLNAFMAGTQFFPPPRS